MQYCFENRNIPLHVNQIHFLAPLPHLHAHLELIYLTKGTSMAYADGACFLLEPGSFFLAFPNQIHFYHDQEAIEGYIMILDSHLFPDFKEILRTKVPASPIITLTHTPAESIKRLDTIFRHYKSEAPLDQAIARGYLLALLAELLSAATLLNAPADYDQVKTLLLYCSEHYTEPLSLDALSQALHLNKYYISHIFSRKLHVSFSDFINGLRVDHACTHLKKGLSITEVAFASGFSSIRTFNRVFLQQTGMTPREYRTAKTEPSY